MSDRRRIVKPPISSFDSENGPSITRNAWFVNTRRLAKRLE